MEDKLLKSKYENDIKTAIYCDRLFKNNLKFISIQIDSEKNLYAQDTNTLKRLKIGSFSSERYLFYFLGYRPTCNTSELARYSKGEIQQGYKTLRMLADFFGGDIKQVS